MIYREILKIKTEKGISNKDLSKKIKNIVLKSGIEEGLCNIYFSSGKAGLTLIENERMSLEDLKRLLKEMAPEDKMYHRPKGGFSYLRSFFVRKELTIPISNRKLIMDDWTSILFWEFSTKKEEREIIVTISGD